MQLRLIKRYEYLVPSKTSLMKIVVNQSIVFTIRTGGNFRFYSSVVCVEICDTFYLNKNYDDNRISRYFCYNSIYFIILCIFINKTNTIIII